MKRYLVTYHHRGHKATVQEICLGKDKDELLMFMDAEHRKRVKKIEECTDERIPKISHEDYKRNFNPFYGQAVDCYKVPRRSSYKRHNK